MPALTTQPSVKLLPANLSKLLYIHYYYKYTCITYMYNSDRIRKYISVRISLGKIKRDAEITVSMRSEEPIRELKEQFFNSF